MDSSLISDPCVSTFYARHTKLKHRTETLWTGALQIHKFFFLETNNCVSASHWVQQGQVPGLNLSLALDCFIPSQALDLQTSLHKASIISPVDCQSIFNTYNLLSLAGLISKPGDNYPLNSGENTWSFHLQTSLHSVTG